MTRQEGEFCNKRCPKCGATLLKNERGDEWCSSPGCEYFDDSDNIFRPDDIGKTVFLTREEAEKALEVRE